MFTENRNENSLGENMRNDGFFARDNMLCIIDDYNTKGIDECATEFYRNAFRDQGIEEVRIFFQVKKPNDGLLRDIEFISVANNVSVEDLKAFIAFMCPNCRKRSIREIITPRANYVDNIRSALDFIGEMENIGVRVTFQPYESLNFNPPFHGRYWFNSSMGYIVDGSLNTYSKGRIFAQRMDEENYGIITEMFREEIIPKAEQFSLLTRDTIVNMQNVILDV